MQWHNYKNKVIWISTILGMIVWISCDVLKAPEAVSNPYDPSDPDFVQPSVIFTSGPLSGEIVDTNSVTFSWQGNDTGMIFYGAFDSFYLYSWGSKTSKTYDDLAEGAHTFRLSPRYSNGVIADSTVVISFEVDNVTGPALIINTFSQSYRKGAAFYLTILAEEVTDIAGISAQIEFDPSIINVYYCQKNTSLLGSNGGQVITFFNIDNTNGLVTADLATVQGTPPYVSGRGTIMSITFKAVGVGTTAIRFGESTKMRDADNNDLEIVNLIDAEIQVTQ